MPDHEVTPHGIIHTLAVPYLDLAVERDGVTYSGRLYPVDESPAPGEPIVYGQKTPLRSSDGKILLLADDDGLWAYSRRIKDWQVFDWERIMRTHAQIVFRSRSRSRSGDEPS
jgi:hypothetical protein